jgi:hypothetical protein
MAYEKYRPAGKIDCSKIRPHVKELVDRCGSYEAAAEYALVGHMTLRRVMNGVYCTVRQDTARKILLALEHRRKEDRSNHRTHKRLLDARRAQAKLENAQLNLLGY